MRPLYQRVLDRSDWQLLPAPVREVHGVTGQSILRGEARVEAGRNWLSRGLGRLIGFPPAAESISVEVAMEAMGDGERWTRRFGDHRFVSELSAGAEPGTIFERFGSLRFYLRLAVDAKGLCMSVVRGSVLGIPLPACILPRSEAREFVDDQGRFCFDVDISLPAIGRIVHYQGCLRPVPPTERSPR